MTADRKVASDCDRFYSEYIEKRKQDIKSTQEYSFLIGYYAHLITDAEFQRYIRDEKRVITAWKRINSHPILAGCAVGMPENWDSVKLLISKSDRMKDIYSIEAEYLETHPNSGYLTDIMGLASFPDYIDYLPEGAITRKIGIMEYMPKKETSKYPYIGMTREEYDIFLDRATELVIVAILKASGV